MSECIEAAAKEESDVALSVVSSLSRTSWIFAYFSPTNVSESNGKSRTLADILAGH